KLTALSGGLIAFERPLDLLTLWMRADRALQDLLLDQRGADVETEVHRRFGRGAGDQRQIGRRRTEADDQDVRRKLLFGDLAALDDVQERRARFLDHLEAGDSGSPQR